MTDTLLPSPGFHHDISIRHQAGPLLLDVHFTLRSWWTAIFAPSGAGKTTTLRIIAGLDRPDHGHILLKNEQSLLAVDTASGIFVPAYKRGVRLVSQRPALFPHLSVLENVRYGRDRIKPQDDRPTGGGELERIMDLCRIPHRLQGQKPSKLSGGERQRLALARALAAGSGRLLLLDEPFTGLESDLRDALIQDLRKWCVDQQTPVLLVTHDLSEVFAAEARVLRMEAGRIVAEGRPEDILAEDRDRLIRRLQGTSRALQAPAPG